MGIDLTLCPVRYEQLPGPILLHTVMMLQCRRYEIYGGLDEVATPLSKAVLRYEDDGIKERTTDSYDKPLHFVTAHSFLRIWDSTPIGFTLNEWDNACLAFVRALNPDHQIVLWWH